MVVRTFVSRSRVRHALLKLEATLWMMRFGPVWHPIAVPAGWLAAAHPPGTGRMLAMTAAVAVGSGAIYVLNDILDVDKDRVTAPELPLASGAVSIAGATAALGVLVAAFVGLVALASVTPARFGLGLAAAVLGAVLNASYGAAKGSGAAGSVFAGVTQATVPLAPWLVAGGGSYATFAFVCGHAVWFGFSCNMQAALRDVELDAEVGNRTFAIRIGPRRALLTGGLGELLALACVLGAAIAQSRVALGVAAVGAAAAVMFAAYRVALRHVESVRTRSERSAVGARTTFVSQSANQIALLAVFSLPVAAVALVLLAAASLLFVRGYERRVFGGALRRSTSRLAAQSSGPPPLGLER